LQLLRRLLPGREPIARKVADQPPNPPWSGRVRRGQRVPDEGDGLPGRPNQLPNRTLGSPWVRSRQVVPQSLELAAGENLLARALAAQGLGHVPEEDCGVGAARGKCPAVGRKGYRVDGPAVAVQAADLPAAGHLPELDGARAIPIVLPGGSEH